MGIEVNFYAREQAKLLELLEDSGKPIIKIDYREVMTYEKSFENGRIRAKKTGSKEKRTKTDASRNANKIATGHGVEAGRIGGQDLD